MKNICEQLPLDITKFSDQVAVFISGYMYFYYFHSTIPFFSQDLMELLGKTSKFYFTLSFFDSTNMRLYFKPTLDAVLNTAKIGVVKSRGCFRRKLL